MASRFGFEPGSVPGQAVEDVPVMFGASIDGGVMASGRCEVRSFGVAAAAAGLVLVAGCVDSGLPGENLPVEQARTKPLAYAVYDSTLDIPPVTVDGRVWMPAGPAEPIPAGLLVQVATDGDRTVYALTSDPEPYARLYVRSGENHVPMARAD
jgi:hypothetical protein